MFGISNRLAYDGGMVLARGKAEQEAGLTEARPLLGESRWFDVGAKMGGPKHFVREQAKVVLWLVRACAERGFVGKDGLPALFVVSPFRSMADGVRKAVCEDSESAGARRQGGGRMGDSLDRHGAHLSRQGAGNGVLAPGGTSDGAIEWACGTPNILNVAVTWAQRRLYVVGDRARWMAASGLLSEFAGLPVEKIAAAAEAM